MRIIDNTKKPAPPADFVNFMERNGLAISLHERESYKRDYLEQYYATLVSGEIKENSILRSPLGNGTTKLGAIIGLAYCIRGKTLVLDPFTTARKEIRVPENWAKITVDLSNLT